MPTPVNPATPTIRIESDGARGGTRVYDSEGHELKGVTHIEWVLDAADGYAKAKLTFVIAGGLMSADEIETQVERLDMKAVNP